MMSGSHSTNTVSDSIGTVYRFLKMLPENKKISMDDKFLDICGLLF